MALFSFECTTNRHKFQIDIPTKSGQHDEQDPEYKRLRPLLTCSYPGCGATAAKGEIQNAVSTYPAITPQDKIEARRKENREMSMEARRMANEMAASGVKEEMVNLDYVPSGEAPKDRYGGDRIQVPRTTIDSLNAKDPRPVREAQS